jgi:hypothetical protein
MYLSGRELSLGYARRSSASVDPIRIPLPVNGASSEEDGTDPNLSFRPDRYIHGGRNFFLRRARAPHWELRVDVSPDKRVTQIAFGDRASVRLDEGCA